ncbi:MAG: histone deacetylase [Candidatus Brocadiae bacterium]|nr:histone deacetylase [Candidatus Brocadiia bacterium]
MRRALNRLAFLLLALVATLGPECGEAERSAVGQDGAEGRQVATTGFVYDEVFLQHETGPAHPESPRRLEAIVNRLEEKGLLARLAEFARRPAAQEWILTVHSKQYVAHVEKSCRQGAAYLDSPDTPISARSYEAAVEAVAGVLSAVDAVVDGTVENAFCAVRPPGHHAQRDRAMGFCIFNNVAIAARYVQKRHNLPRVLIVDWDVHHGNGTQRAFYDDPTVLYFGVHQYPFYPGTGAESEQGAAEGKGYTINVPLPAGSGDAEFTRALQEKLKPAALAFKPDFVLISAGFDAHEADPLGGMRVTSEGFAELTRIVKGIAEKCCQGRLVSVLEGGYDLKALADSVEAHIRVLMQ